MAGASRQAIELEVAKRCEPLCQALGLELVEIQYVKEGRDWFLRVFVDKPGGVGLDDCQAISRALSESLDADDPMPGAYQLEVSSPGLDRPLKRLEDADRFDGQIAEVRTYAPVEGRKRWQGRLSGAHDGAVCLVADDGTQVDIPWDQVSKARLVPEFKF